MHPHTTQSLLPLFHRPSGVEGYQGSRGSTAQRSLCKPLSLAASWVRSCEEQKKLRGYPPGGKLLAPNAQKPHWAKLSTWRAPRNSENAAKTAAQLRQ